MSNYQFFLLFFNNKLNLWFQICWYFFFEGVFSSSFLFLLGELGGEIFPSSTSFFKFFFRDSIRHKFQTLAIAFFFLFFLFVLPLLFLKKKIRFRMIRFFSSLASLISLFCGGSITDKYLCSFNSVIFLAYSINLWV